MRTNAGGVTDKTAIEQILKDGARMDEEAAQREAEILAIVERKFS